MKILQSSASSQTLKIIPRSYPELVDVVIKNEDTKDVTTLSDVTTVSNLGYLEIPSVFTLVEDTFYSFEVWDKVNVDGVKFISANNEYISSPDQSYFGADITGLDISVSYNNLSTQTATIGSQGIGAAENDNFGLSIGSTLNGFSFDFISFNLGFLNTILPSNLVNYLPTASSPIPLSGIIRVTSDGVNIVMYLDGVEVATTPVIYTDISAVSGFLYFAASFDGVSIAANSGIIISEIILNNHIWTFSEGTGGTTTNSESVVSTLNSDVSTELMWSNEQNEIIYKGKIFCTNQETYSINNGEYTTRSRNNKYIVYGQ